MPEKTSLGKQTLRGGHVWDPSTRPSGPPAPAGQAYTARGRAIGGHLAQVHDHLRGELDQIRDLLGQVKRGALSVGRARAAINEMTMRQNNWTLGAYCASYCAMVTAHHGMEDSAVFPHLRGRDAKLAPVIDRLEAEHVIIHEVLQEIDRALVNLVTNPGDFTEIEEAVDTLTDTLLSHLTYEEGEITEPLSRFGFYAGQL
jgi:iron-sulfur cluster repair protein YtfE (RIC family)